MNAYFCSLMTKQAEFTIFTLANGLRVIHKEVDRPVAHCGILINAGSRDEQTDESGIAHFIEHAIFKGTKRRRAYHILNRLDSVGGEFDAYTSKEQTVIYASFLSEYYERAIELLSDVVLNSEFPEKEIAKEKEVVLDEIKSYQDSPADQIYDDFESLVFKSHALGNPILGSPESIALFDRKKILNFTDRLYRAENMVFSSVGAISEKKLRRKIEKHFGSLKPENIQKSRLPFQGNAPKKQHEYKGNVQTHCMMGKACFGADHPKRIGLSLLNNLLGGPAMNSILNLKVREKYGFTYNIESNYSPYSDSGIFSIYLGTDPKFIDRCLSIIFKELKVLRQKKLSKNKLHLAKQQLKGQIALARESNSNLMLSYGKSLLTKNNVKGIELIHREIEAINSDEIMEIAREILDEKEFTFLFFDGNAK